MRSSFTSISTCAIISISDDASSWQHCWNSSQFCVHSASYSSLSHITKHGTAVAVLDWGREPNFQPGPHFRGDIWIAPSWKLTLSHLWSEMSPATLKVVQHLNSVLQLMGDFVPQTSICRRVAACRWFKPVQMSLPSLMALKSKFKYHIWLYLFFNTCA